MAILSPRGSSSSSSSSSGSDIAARQGVPVRGSGSSDPEPEPEPEPQPEPEPEPEPTGGDTGLGFSSDGGLTPEQLEAIQNQDFVDQEEVEDTSTGGLTPDELRDIANQEFVSDDVTAEINQSLDQEQGVSLTDMLERQENPGSPEADIPPTPEVSTDPEVSSEEAASMTTTSDLDTRFVDMMDRLQTLQERLVEAQTPTEDEQALREQIRENRENFEEAQATSRQRQAPQFAIRGELEERGDTFSRRQDRLRNDLQAQVEQRSNRVDQLTQQMSNTQTNFQLLQSLQKMTQPDVLQTQVNDQTGEVFSVVQDPMSGQVTTQKVGNVGQVKEDFEAIGRITLENGREAMYGRTKDGDFTTKEITDEQGNPVLSQDESDSGEGEGFSFDEDDRGRLIGTGLTPDDINALEQDLKTSNIDQVLEGSGLSPDQRQVVRDTLQGISSTKRMNEEEEDIEEAQDQTRWLTKDFLRKRYPKEVIENNPDKYGDVSFDEYLNRIWSQIEQIRNNNPGMSDRDALRVVEGS